MSFVKNLLLILMVCVLTLTLTVGQEVPPTPCPDYFQYYKMPDGDIYGRITLPHDYKTTLVLGINASMKGYYTSGASLKIKMDTPGQDLIYQRANTLRYRVYFPFQHSIPRITHIQLNNRGYCDGPPEELIAGAPGVTSLWSEHRFYFETVQTNEHTFTPSIPEYPVGDIDQSIFQSESPSEIRFTSPSPILPIETTRRPASYSRNRGCGESKNNQIVPLILGGDEVSEGMFPWLAAMFVSQGYYYEYKCTANLISEKHVLTAARCAFLYKAQLFPTENIVFVFGKSDLRNWAHPRTVQRGVVAIIPNPHYNQVSGHGDVSIMTLDRPVEFSEKISPVCLWTENDNIDYIVGKMGTVAGWGADEAAQRDGRYHILQAKYLDMPVVSDDECLGSNFSYLSLTSDMTFCAGRRNGKGTCVGDVGAPFMILRGSKYYIRGLASLTLNDDNGKCDLSYFMIFSDVAKVANWIKDSMGKY